MKSRPQRERERLENTMESHFMEWEGKENEGGRKGVCFISM